MELKDTISKKHVSSFTTLVSEINSGRVLDLKCILEDLVCVLFNKPKSKCRRIHCVVGV